MGCFSSTGYDFSQRGARRLLGKQGQPIAYARGEFQPSLGYNSNCMMQPAKSSPNTGNSWRFRAAVFGTPLLWVLQLVLNQLLTPSLCAAKRIWVLHVITGVFLVLAGMAVAACARDWSRLSKTRSAPADAEETAQAQYVAVVGVMTSTFFATLILASGIPAILVDPCQDRSPIAFQTALPYLPDPLWLTCWNR